ncbi:TetR/AcrR family transcriptional regulator [candidate division KSB1 bacterium]|nr:TetR/AcrR family transcriptional regulator [candidate division KSB1 bacterium]
MGITERREREKERRKNEILNAAEKVFFTRGIAVATMDEVAEKAELSKGTLYLYFPSKQAVYFGLAERALIKLKQFFLDAVAQKKSGIDKIRAIGEAYYRFSKEHRDYFQTIAHWETTEMEFADETVMMQCHEAGRDVQEIVVKALTTGMQDGSIRNDLDPVKTAFLLEGQMTGLIQMISREEKHLKMMDHIDPQELVELFYEMTYQSLTVK